MNVYAYEIDNKLYINLTNKCTNSCDFCVRQDDTYEGYFLWLDHEPSCEEVLSQIDEEKLKQYEEVVFCGYGEPTYRLNELITLGKHFKSKNKKVRLNTNGHGDEINERPIAPLLKDAVDKVSVSLNQSDKGKYDAVCHSIYGEKAFDLLLDFAKSCKAQGIDTVFSVVDVDGVDVEKCQNVAGETGIPLFVRDLIE